MKIPFMVWPLLLMILCSVESFSQDIVEHYESKRNDSIRIGTEEGDHMPLIQSGYTLMLPKDKAIKGVLIFLEDSGYDERNKNASQYYEGADERGFAVLSVSSEIPFDFYFSKKSLFSTHMLIEQAFIENNLPNERVFFLGASLVGHRAMRYIKFMKEGSYEFKPNIEGVVICNFTLDWTRKWYQHQRDIRINRINLWEPKFMNYMLETHLKGTPETVPEHYHDFSPYSYFDQENRNIEVYKDYAIRAYIEPSIKYRLKKYFRTLYENNSTDIVGFLAELELAGNENTELIVIQSAENAPGNKNTQSTWDSIDKDELLSWIDGQKK